MKNSQLALRVFMGLSFLGGLITILIINPFFILYMAIALFMIYLFFAAIAAIENYNTFGKKWNIFYYISKWLDSLPQIIKDKK